MPTAHASGLPPKVLPCSPGWKTAMTSARDTTAETGRIPPPSALPRMYASGTTPSWSQANVAPVRPSPDWISSASIRTRLSVHSRRTSRRKPSGGMMTPRLALDGLEQDRDRVLVDRSGEGRGVAVGHAHEPGRERAEAGARGRIVGEADDRGRAAVEVAAEDDDPGPVVGHALRLVAPLAGHLERGLHGLGARVHRQDHVHAAQRRELRGEGAQQVVVERAAGEREAAELPLGRGDEARMAVAEVQRAVAREQVQVAAPVDVLDPGALAAGEHDRQRMVVVRGVCLDLRDRALAFRRCLARTGSLRPSVTVMISVLPRVAGRVIAALREPLRLRYSARSCFALRSKKGIRNGSMKRPATRSGTKSMRIPCAWPGSSAVMTRVARCSPEARRAARGRPGCWAGSA